MTHKEYLLSAEWNKKRHIILKRDWYKCVCCNSQDYSEVHHRTYKTLWTMLEIYDLYTLCNKCHKLIHKNTKIIWWEIVQKRKRKKKFIKK